MMEETKNNEKKMDFDFPAKLREILSKNKLTQLQLADMLGLRQSQISNWLHCRSLPSYYTLRRMCTELKMSASEILLLN